LFGKNDFEPSDRKELMQMDPGGFTVVATKWGLNRQAELPPTS